MNKGTKDPSRFVNLPYEEKLQIAREWAAMAPTKTKDFYGVDYPSISAFAHRNGIHKYGEEIESLTDEQKALINELTLSHMKWATKKFIPRHLKRSHWAFDAAWDVLMRMVILATKSWTPDGGRNFNSYWFNIAQKYVPLKLYAEARRRGYGRAAENGRKVFSLEKTITRHSATTLESNLADKGVTSAEICELNERIRAIRALLNGLSKRTSEIIRLYYGIGCEPMTYQKIGDMHGITRERVRQIINVGCRRIKTLAERRKLNVEEMLETIA